MKEIIEALEKRVAEHRRIYNNSKSPRHLDILQEATLTLEIIRSMPAPPDKLKALEEFIEKNSYGDLDAVGIIEEKPLLNKIKELRGEN